MTSTAGVTGRDREGWTAHCGCVAAGPREGRWDRGREQRARAAKKWHTLHPFHPPGATVFFKKKATTAEAPPGPTDKYDGRTARRHASHRTSSCELRRLELRLDRNSERRRAFLECKVGARKCRETLRSTKRALRGFEDPGGAPRTAPRTPPLHPAPRGRAAPQRPHRRHDLTVAAGDSATAAAAVAAACRRRAEQGRQRPHGAVRACLQRGQHRRRHGLQRLRGRRRSCQALHNNIHACARPRTPAAAAHHSEQKPLAGLLQVWATRPVCKRPAGGARPTRTSQGWGTMVWRRPPRPRPRHSGALAQKRCVELVCTANGGDGRVIIAAHGGMRSVRSERGAARGEGSWEAAPGEQGTGGRCAARWLAADRGQGLPRFGGPRRSARTRGARCSRGAGGRGERRRHLFATRGERGATHAHGRSGRAACGRAPRTWPQGWALRPAVAHDRRRRGACAARKRRPPARAHKC